jgi:hypothetical protein
MPTAKEVKEYTMLQDRALMKHRLAMSMPMSEWPKPDEISAKAKRYARNPQGAFDSAFSGTTKLGRALRAKYRTQEAALRALGINPSVLAEDKKMARDDETENGPEEDNEGALHRFLESRMNPEDMERCKELIANLMGEEGEDEELDEPDAREMRTQEMDAEDDNLGEPFNEKNVGPSQFGGPKPFKNMPMRGGGKSMGEDSYAGMFPQAERIGLDPMYHGVDKRGQVRQSPAIAFDSSSDETSYDAMFPDAKRIGIR